MKAASVSGNLQQAGYQSRHGTTLSPFLKTSDFGTISRVHSDEAAEIKYITQGHTGKSGRVSL